MSPDRTNDTNDPATLRQEAAESRRKVSEDLDELGERLSSEGVKREARSALDSAEDVVADVTRDVADRAVRRVEEAGDRFAERLGDFPVPLALIGLGVGWVLMRAQSEREAHDAETPFDRDRVVVDDDGYGYVYDDSEGSEMRDEPDLRDPYAAYDGTYDTYTGGRTEYRQDGNRTAWIAGAIAAGTGLLVAGVVAALLHGDDDDEVRRPGRGRVRGGVLVGADARIDPTGYGARRARGYRGSSRYDASDTEPSGYRSSNYGSSSYRSSYRSGSARSADHGAMDGRSAGEPPATASAFEYSFENDRPHFETAHRDRYGEDEPFARYLPAYRFGTQLGAADRLSDRNWDEIEEGVRDRWQARGRSDWESHREAVRYGFERVRVQQDPGDDPERLPDG